MNVRATDRLWTLTDKEKVTLRLIVRGHDAKSTARSLGLSVHTINERLRDARRKMAVSSSREAARLLLEAEGGLEAPHPDFVGDDEIGDDARLAAADQDGAPVGGAGRSERRPSALIGVAVMTLFLGLLAFAALAPDGSAPAPAATSVQNAEVVDAARSFLTLIDQARWEESYKATTKSFQKLNTLKVWSDVSVKAHAPLGAVTSRTFISQESVPTPPHGYEMVKFRTSFANKPDAIETVTLDREGGSWRIAGIYID